MSLAARRVGYSFAIAVFLVVTPIVIGLTLGYRWTGWDRGFVKTGVLVVSSNPRAFLSINDELRGETPKRVAGLTPGTYRVAIEKTGYHPWRQLVRIGANAASVVGPVHLFPSEPSIKPVAQNVPAILHDLIFSVAWQLNPLAAAWEAAQMPTGQIRIRLPSQPTSVAQSRRGQTAVFEHGPVQTVLTASRVDQPWVIDRTEALAWANESETIFWGRRGQDIIQFDAVTQQQTPIVQATSHTVFDNRLWYTQQTNTETILYRRAAIGNDPPVLVQSYPGQWELLTGVSGLVLRQSTRQTQLLQFDPITQQLRQTSLGTMDRMFWTNDAEPPIWIDGVNLKTIVANQIRLLERSPNEFLYLGWTEPLKLLLAVEPTQFTIRSYGAEQGQGIAMTYALSPQRQVVQIDLPQDRLMLYDSETQNVYEVRWDEPARSDNQ